MCPYAYLCSEKINNRWLDFMDDIMCICRLPATTPRVVLMISALGNTELGVSQVITVNIFAHHYLLLSNFD